MNSLIVGLQYGDCGKGRVAAYFLEKDNYDWSVRFNGGPNAGHTVWHQGKKYALHHLPAGAALGKKVALDAGMVINPKSLKEECDTVGMNYNNLFISANAHVITERHMENDRDGSGVGSTKRGIAYAYGDKTLRYGTRWNQCSPNQDRMGNDYTGLPPIADNESALYESAQGIMLDLDYGHYPYVTSSSVFPSCIHNIGYKIGVMKAYTSRVGDGPPNFESLDWLSHKGQEFGTTTGRLRKCYWMILDEVKYAISLYKPDAIVVTKLDVLQDEQIYIWNNNSLQLIGNLDNYKNFLLEQFPQIKYFSEAADGDLIEV